MTTSVFNRQRRRRRAMAKVLWRREQRHTSGEFRRDGWREAGLNDGPNAQIGRDQRGRTKK